MKTISLVLTNDTLASLEAIAVLRNDTIEDMIMEAIRNYHYPAKKKQVS